MTSFQRGEGKWEVVLGARHPAFLHIILYNLSPPDLFEGREGCISWV